MTHDTDPTQTAGDTEPLADSTRRAAESPAGAAAWTEAATDPGSPPEVDTLPDRPALAYGADVGDPEVAALLGKLAPARVAPPVGDTRETNGHAAAAFVVPLRSPPKAFETPPRAPPVLVETSTVERVGQAEAAPPVVPPKRAVNVTTVPRAQAVAPTTPKVVAGLAAGVLLTTLGVLAWFGTTSHEANPASTSSSMPAPIVARGASATPAAPATASAPTTTTPAASSTAASASGEGPRSTGGVPAPHASHPSPPAAAAGRSAGSVSTSAPSASSAKPPARLPDDIRWTVE